MYKSYEVNEGNKVTDKKETDFWSTAGMAFGAFLSGSVIVLLIALSTSPELEEYTSSHKLQVIGGFLGISILFAFIVAAASGFRDETPVKIDWVVQIHHKGVVSTMKVSATTADTARYAAETQLWWARYSFWRRSSGFVAVVNYDDDIMLIPVTGITRVSVMKRPKKE